MRPLAKYVLLKAAPALMPMGLSALAFKSYPNLSAALIAFEVVRSALAALDILIQRCRAPGVVTAITRLKMFSYWACLGIPAYFRVELALHYLLFAAFLLLAFSCSQEANFIFKDRPRLLPRQHLAPKLLTKVFWKAATIALPAFLATFAARLVYAFPEATESSTFFVLRVLDATVLGMGFIAQHVLSRGTLGTGGPASLLLVCSVLIATAGVEPLWAALYAERILSMLICAFAFRLGLTKTVITGQLINTVGYTILYFFFQSKSTAWPLTRWLILIEFLAISLMLTFLFLALISRRTRFRLFVD